MSLYSAAVAELIAEASDQAVIVFSVQNLAVVIHVILLMRHSGAI